MILKTKNISEIKDLYKDYLNYISQYFNIKNLEAWRETALAHLKKYSTDTNRHLYIIKDSDTTFGFALVNQHFRFIKTGSAIAEFYIKDEYKRKGFGKNLAEHVFTKHPGDWEVAVSKKNNLALKFWKKTISCVTKEDFKQVRNESFDGYGFVFNNS